jgi:hypothetical protein
VDVLNTMQEPNLFTTRAKTGVVLNPDGVSVKGCTIIYAPAGQAGEYAPLAANPYRGCGHGCRYCYVPLVTKQLRKDFDAGAVPRENFLTRLRKDALKYQAAGITEQVMFSFTTDVYNQVNTSLTRPSIEIAVEHGLAFCVLTKGGTRALADIGLYRPERDAFASTMTSLDDDFSRKYLTRRGRATASPHCAPCTSVESSLGSRSNQRSMRKAAWRLSKPPINSWISTRSVALITSRSKKSIGETTRCG